MVNIVAIASDPQDIHPRKWIMWYDYEPTTEWDSLASLQAEDAVDKLIEIHESRYSGDTQTGQIDLPDGKHSIYFGISQDGGPSFGTYSGTISFDGISKTFAGFDVNVIGKWDVNVKNNAVVSLVGQSTPGVKLGFLDKIKGGLMFVETEFKNGMTHEFIMAHWPYLAAGVAVPIVGGGTYLILKKKFGKGRRV